MGQDKGIPARKDEMRVEITVIQDQGTLRFSSNKYQTTISENRDVNSEVIRVSTSPGVCLKNLIHKISI